MHESGVYMIRDTVSGRRYIGSAVSIKKRWKEHRRGLEQGHHHSKFMLRCWRVRPESFEFHVILYCSRENLLMYEQLLIDGYKPEFNSAPKAGSQLGFRMSDESKAKLSEAAKRTKNFTGRKHSEDSKRKISESRKGKGGDKGWTQERRDRISAALKGREISPDMRRRISEKLTGTSTGRGQLTEDQVRGIRVMRSETGWGKCRISKALGIKETTVNAVLGNHAYLWVT